MPQKNLSFYIHSFKNLRRDRARIKEGAPHKPILLLSIIQLYQNDIIDSNKIFITPELVALFKSNWAQLVITGHDANFSLPFYHMKSESFWSLVPKAGCESWLGMSGSMRSFNNLNTAVEYAEIDVELTELLFETESRNILQQILLDEYFPSTGSFQNTIGLEYLQEIQRKIIQESPENYQSEIDELRKNVSAEKYEEEIFLRGETFKREIPKIYQYTCCISGLSISIAKEISMIDACHIVPFSKSHDDTISNGIALCPNLHRAFDRGLISISDDYKVLVAKNFSENSESQYQIGIFKDKDILLPSNPGFFPSRKNLAEHRQRFSFA